MVVKTWDSRNFSILWPPQSAGSSVTTAAGPSVPSTPPAAAAADDAPTMADWLVVGSIVGVIGGLLVYIALTSPRRKG